jgi:hypothetical protein
VGGTKKLSKSQSVGVLTLNEQGMCDFTIRYGLGADMMCS